MKALILAESENAARELSVGARTVCDDVTMVAVGRVPFTGVADRCFHIAVPDGFVADDAYPTVNRLFDKIGVQLVIAQCSPHMTSLIGRLASHANSSVIANACSFEGSIASSFYYGGVGVRRAKPKGPYGFYTVSEGVFDGSQAYGSDVVEEVPFEAPSAAVRKLGQDELPPMQADITASDVLVSCGRGFLEEEDLRLARELADACGGEVSCSRPLAEILKWMPHEACVGVSAQTVAPRVYLAAGISGQMQHVVGCDRSQTIVAVNKDPQAPIFEQCDIGIVGDLYQVIPALVESLNG